MKKINKLISLSVIMCLLISSLCVMNVSAETGDLLYDMNLSGFQKGNAGESWGITNNGSSNTVTVKLNDGVTTSGVSTGSITHETYTNVKGETVPYLNFNQIYKSGNYSGSDSCNRIWIEDTAWINKEITAEVWLKVKPTDATADRLLTLYGEDDDDRTSLDRVIAVEVYPTGKWETHSSLSSGTNSAASDVNNSNGEWVHVAIVRHLESNAGKSKIPIYVNGTAIRSTLGLKAVTETVAGLLLGTHATAKTDTAPHDFGVASVKIYDGELTANQVKSHYNAEVDNYTLAPETLEVTSYSPAQETTLISHKAGSFKATFNNCIDEETIDSGIGLFDENDEEVLTYKTLSNDKKTVTLTPAGYLAEGEYNIKVNFELTSLNDKSATADESPAYTIDLFEYNAADSADFATIAANADGCSEADIKSCGADDYIGAWASNTGMANYKITKENGESILTMQDTSESDKKSVFVRVDLPDTEKFTTGNVEFSFSVKGGNNTYCFLQVDSSKNVLYYKPDTGISHSVNEKSVAFEDNKGEIKDGDWYNVTVAFSRNDTSEEWKYTVYMKGANGEETPANSYTLSGYTGSLSQFTLYNRASEDAADYQPMQLKNISLKHVISHGGYLSGRVISGGDIVYYSYDKEALLDGVDDNATIIVAAYKGDEMLAVDVKTKADAESTGNLTFDESIDGAITLKLIKLYDFNTLIPYGPAVVATAVLYPAGE